MRIIESIEVLNLPHVNQHKIILQEGDEHLILTGPNRTGKSAILHSLACGINHEVKVISSILTAEIITWDRNAFVDSVALLDMFKGKPIILIIDDIEVGLDLMQQRTFISIITSRYPNVQIIGSTHSPSILAGAPKTSVYSLDNSMVLTDLENMSVVDISDKLYGLC